MSKRTLKQCKKCSLQVVQNAKHDGQRNCENAVKKCPHAPRVNVQILNERFHIDINSACASTSRKWSLDKHLTKNSGRRININKISGRWTNININEPLTLRGISRGTVCVCVVFPLQIKLLLFFLPNDLSTPSVRADSSS